jgi:hypothetical protein
VYTTEHHTAATENQILFCQTSLELAQLEQRARAKLSLRDNGYRAAKFADGIVEIVRRRHRHVAGCPKCLVAEALAR